MTDMTLAQLTQYNGKNGQPSYVAINGKIINVSSVFPSGVHHSSHNAGIDLTETLRNKHGLNQVSGYPVIGNLITDQCNTITCNFTIEQ